MSRARRAAAIAAGGAALVLASYGLGAGVGSLVPASNVPAPASTVYVPAAFCPAGLRVVPTPYLARQPANAPLCEGGPK
jgi:hypothetical protein